MLASSSTPSDPYAPPPAAPYTPPANPYGTPSTDYGAGTPPANPYGASTPPPANPYGAPPASPYGVPPANPYGTPSSPGYNPAPGGFGAPGVPYGQAPYMPQQPKKRMNGCVMAIIIVASIFVLLVAGLITAGVVLANKAGTAITNINATTTADMGTANADLTPTTGNDGSTPTTSGSSSVPSSSQIDPTAQANITGAQTASGVDSNYRPTNVTSNFTSSDTIYITYTLAGKSGYTIEKTYDNSDGTMVTKTSTPYTIHSGDTVGYFSLTGGTSGSYTTGVYWCQQSDCSDAALAQVVSFTIS